MSPPTDHGEQPHLISLVHQSKRALEQGKALCFRADTTSTSSAKEVTDLLALNARIQWISNAVIEQLKAWLTRTYCRIRSSYVRS
jgi:autophagy-related protein 17